MVMRDIFFMTLSSDCDCLQREGGNCVFASSCIMWQLLRKLKMTWKQCFPHVFFPAFLCCQGFHILPNLVSNSDFPLLRQNEEDTCTLSCRCFSRLFKNTYVFILNILSMGHKYVFCVQCVDSALFWHKTYHCSFLILKYKPFFFFAVGQTRLKVVGHVNRFVRLHF